MMKLCFLRFVALCVVVSLLVYILGAREARGACDDGGGDLCRPCDAASSAVVADEQLRRQRFNVDDVYEVVIEALRRNMDQSYQRLQAPTSRRIDPSRLQSNVRRLGEFLIVRMFTS